MVRTPGFHPGNKSSILLRATKQQIMNLNFNSYLRGTFAFITIAFLMSFISKFTPTSFNFFECYGFVMICVAFKTGYDIYNDSNMGEF